eukprot:1159579-Pelagomonas_calceolata.AAC.5
MQKGLWGLRKEATLVSERVRALSCPTIGHKQSRPWAPEVHPMPQACLCTICSVSYPHAFA